MSKYILNLIEQGEHQSQDFKYQINDAKKIARSISAFANTEGGRLLIGVKDNGHIAGIRSEEEYYMMETASSLYCRPEVSIEANHFTVEGKQVLEIVVPMVEKKPVLAPDEAGKWQAYARFNDMNLVADDILRNYWKMQSENKGVYIQYSEEEKIILNYLENNPDCTFVQIKKALKIKYSVLRRVLINFVLAGVLHLDFTEDGSKFRVNDN